MKRLGAVLAGCPSRWNRELFGMTSDSWDDYAAEWDDDPAARSYAAAAFNSLLEALDERGISLSGAVMCDFGCGTGLMIESLVDRVDSVDAVDTSPAMLQVLEAKIVERGWSNVRALMVVPSSSSSHDLVVCSSVCSFLEDYPGTVRKLAGLLRPGGLFVQWDWERDDEDDSHGLSRNEIRDAITSAGLVHVHVDTAFEVDLDGQVMRPLIGVGQAPETITTT